MFHTEFEFTLPKGYVDKDGNLHRDGIMRLATAADEIIPLKDRRVQQNSGYLTILILARVIVKLGTLTEIATEVIENMFTIDMAYLQDLYTRINQFDSPSIKVTCPHCNREFETIPDFLGDQELK